MPTSARVAKQCRFSDDSVTYTVRGAEPAWGSSASCTLHMATANRKRWHATAVAGTRYSKRAAHVSSKHRRNCQQAVVNPRGLPGQSL